MTTGTIDLEIAPKIEAFRREMMKMPGITQEAADKSAESLRRGLYTKAAREAAGLANANKVAAADTGKAWTDVGKKVAELAGGPFARLGQVVFDLVPKSKVAAGSLSGVGSATTAMGVAAAGTVAATAALGAGLVVMANKASAARQRLIEAGHGFEIPQEAHESLNAYDDAVKELKVSLDKLIVSIGSEFAGDLAIVVGYMADNVERTQALAGAFDGLKLAVQSVLATAARSTVLAQLLGITWESAQAAHEAEQATLDQADAYAQLGMVAEDAIVDEEIRQNLIREGNRLVEERKRREQEAAQAARDRVAAELAAEQAIRDELLAQNEAALETRQRQLEEEQAQKRAWWKEQLEREKALADEVAQILKRRIEAQAASEEKLAELREDFALASIGAAEDITGAVAAGYDTQTKAGRKAAKKLFAWQQAAALAQVEISTALAIIKAFELFGPPPSPAGILAAGTAAAQGIAAGVRIGTQEPSFFSGGIVPGNRGDAVTTTLHGGEPVLNTMAADNLGPDIIAALNAGLDPLKGMGGGTTVVQIDGRDVASRVMRRTKQRPAGFVSPYGRA